MGFDTANKAWIESIKSCVRETVNSSEGLIAAARAAAEVILETNEEYDRSSSESKDAIGGVTSRALTEYEETYTADYLT